MKIYSDFLGRLIYRSFYPYRHTVYIYLRTTLQVKKMKHFETIFEALLSQLQLLSQTILASIVIYFIFNIRRICKKSPKVFEQMLM